MDATLEDSEQYSVSTGSSITNKELYGNLHNMLKVSKKLSDRRLRFEGHYCRNTEELISRSLLWKPKHGKRKAGRPSIIFTDILRQDTGLETNKLRTAMLDRSVWRAITL